MQHPREFGQAVIDAAGNGDNTIIAAPESDRIYKVTSLTLVSAGAVTARFESGAGGTALTGQMTLAASTVLVLPYNPAGWFQTKRGELLNLELSGAVSVDGCLTYELL